MDFLVKDSKSNSYWIIEAWPWKAPTLSRPFTRTGRNTPLNGFAAGAIRCRSAGGQPRPGKRREAFSPAPPPCPQAASLVQPNAVSFIFKLGKHRSLPLRPLRQLSLATQSRALRLPTPLPIAEAFASNGQAAQGDQKSSQGCGSPLRTAVARSHAQGDGSGSGPGFPQEPFL